MRLLLDEGFPAPPGFRVESVDATVDVTTLRSFDGRLTGASIPDWYLYLRADEAGFDALVTRDWHQSEQTEEMWVLAKTSLSIVTWRRPLVDPVQEWGQLLAFLPEVRRMIGSHGPSVVFLPAVRLDSRSIDKASSLIGILAKDLDVAGQQLRDQARALVLSELEAMGELERFRDVLR